MTVLCNHTLYIAESQEIEFRGLASDITIRQAFRNTCVMLANFVVNFLNTSLFTKLLLL